MRATQIGGKWRVQIELADPVGTVVYRPELDDIVFPTSAEAEAAGWRLAQEWLRRYADALGADERALLMDCSHRVAHCDACSLSHGFFELIDDRFCARCRSDLISLVRIHLWECPEVAIRRARIAIQKSTMLGKSNQEIRDAAGVTRAESDAVRRLARASRHETSTCPHCQRMIEPGQGVSFQHGELVHLSCYEQLRQRRI